MNKWHIIVTIIGILGLSYTISNHRLDNIDAQIEIQSFQTDYEALYNLHVSKIKTDPCNQLFHYQFITSFLRDNPDGISKVQEYYSAGDSFSNCPEIFSYAQGFIHRDLKNYKKAESFFLESANSQNPFNGGYNSLGYMFHNETGDTIQAIKYYKLSLELFPESKRAINNLFSLYLSQKDYQSIASLISNKSHKPLIRPYLMMAYHKEVKSHLLAVLYFFKGNFQYASILSVCCAILLMLLWATMLYKIKRSGNITILNYGIAILLGCLSPFITIFIHFITPEIKAQNQILHNLLLHFLKVGPIEELAKLISVILIAKIFSNYKTQTNSLIYGGLAAIGFATIENIQYFNNYGPAISFSRFIFSVILHISLTGIMSYGYFLFIKKRIRLGGLIKTFLFVAFLHGLFDFVVSSMAFNTLFIIFRLIHYASYLIVALIIKAYFNLIYFSVKSDDNINANLSKLASIYAISLLVTFGTAFISSTIKIGFSNTLGTIFFHVFLATYVIEYTYRFLLSDNHELPDYLKRLFGMKVTAFSDSEYEVVT